jgi:hypothetical protein
MSKCVSDHYAMKTYRKLMYSYRSTFYYWLRHWLELSGRIHAPNTLPMGKSPRYPMRLIAGLDEMEKWIFFTLPGLELRLFVDPAHSQSLYRLLYRSSLCVCMCVRVCVCICAYIYIYTYIHTYIHTYAKVGTNFAEKRRSLGRHNVLAG